MVHSFIRPVSLCSTMVVCGCYFQVTLVCPRLHVRFSGPGSHPSCNCTCIVIISFLGWYSSLLPVCNSMKSACFEVTYSWLCMYQYLQVSYDNKPEWLQPSQLPVPSELTGWSTIGQVQCSCMYMPVCTGLYVVLLVYIHAYVQAYSCVGICTCQYLYLM